jgi:ATP-dependent protease Clp ATPase subunit
MFVFAGAFDGLEGLLAPKGGKQVTGFAPAGGAGLPPVQEGRLRDALVEYGMLPEFINRLSGILPLPAPTTDDMLALLEFGNGPVEACNQRLRGLGAEIVLTGNTASEMAKYACDTKSYCRGMQLLLQAAADHLVYEGIKGQVAIEPGDLKQLAAGKWLELEQPEKVKMSVEPDGNQSRLVTVA